VKVRTIFISDVHLGTSGCQHERLLEFLKAHQADKLVLIGDIIDGWRLRKRWYWPDGHNRVIQQILKMSKSCQVVYVTGNHDEFLRPYAPLQVGSIQIVNEHVHDGDTLVVHGDLYDGVTKYHRWLALLGDTGYVILLKINGLTDWMRRRLGLGYWSLSAVVKHRVKRAVDFIWQFESSLADECRSRGYRRVVCGHIHHAEVKDIDGIQYCNCGDWVESCTAIVETRQGTYTVVRWEDRNK